MKTAKSGKIEKSASSHRSQSTCRRLLKVPSSFHAEAQGQRFNSRHLPTVLLYELALQSEPPLHPLPVSPAIFKSMVSTVFDLLIDRSLPTTLWLKLPRGAAWQAEIDRFLELATAPYTLYLLQSPQENEAPPADPSPNPFDGGLLEEEERQTSGAIAVLLSPKLRLRREYFLLLKSPRLSCLMLAHRSRSMRSSPLAEEKALLEAEFEQKQRLLGLCSFALPAIVPVAQGIHEAIAASHAAAAVKAAATAALNFSETTADLTLVGQLISSQIQRQEEIWRSSLLLRRQAAVVDRLQGNHAALLKTASVKDEFLKTLCQELRTPLTTMKTAVTLLNSPTLKMPQRQRYMEMLTRECDRQSSLLTSVLDLVQLEDMTEQTPMQPLRLAEIVPAIVSTYQPLAQEKGIMLAYTVPEDLSPAACLSSWLRQIVINLLHNGIKFTLTGGKVWVRAKQQGDFVEIEVSDTGIGIAPADLPNIFDRFYRVRHGSEEISGAGLGLSIVQQLLLRCGGSISVRSKPSEGSTFSVLLPVYRSDAPDILRF